MNLFEALKGRRSVRSFKSDLVPESKIAAILEAGMYAPSAGKQIPWEFIVLTERKLLDVIPAIHRGGAMAKEAPLGIVVCGNLERENHAGTWMLDCAAATQNILLAAHGLGLGSVWVGIYPREERIEGIRTLLHVPQHVVPFSIAVIGYPSGDVPPAERFDKSLIHNNRW